MLGRLLIFKNMRIICIAILIGAWNFNISGDKASLSELKQIVDFNKNIAFEKNMPYLLSCDIKITNSKGASDNSPQNYASGSDIEPELKLTLEKRNEKGKLIGQHTFKLPWFLAANKKYTATKIFMSGNKNACAYKIVLCGKGFASGISFEINNINIEKTTWEEQKKEVEKYLFSLKNSSFKRQRIADKTYVFFRFIPKYQKGKNYLCNPGWIDRPLFTDRSQREESDKSKILYSGESIINNSSFMKDVELAEKYEGDGFSILFGCEELILNYIAMLKFLEEKKIKNFKILPGTHFNGKNSHLNKYFSKAMQDMQNSPNSFKIKNKCVIDSFHASRKDPFSLKAFLNNMRKKYGDAFSYVACVREGVDLGKFQNKKLTIYDIKEHQEILRSYLDAADGIMFTGSDHAAKYNADNIYGNQSDLNYLKNYLVPVFKSVLAEDKYKDKLFGFSACQGYYYQAIGNLVREDATKTLRGSFEIALDAEPDFIINTEWNEFNENTCFQPTVNRSFSSQRIIKYLIRKANGKKAVPNEGDNLKLPNLIISYQKVLMLGEKLNIELLNVPDSDSDSNYSATVILRDANGKIAATSKPINFRENEFKAQVISFPSEDFSGSQVLEPELKIQKYKNDNIDFKRGLRFIRISPSVNDNYLYVREPLRDICQPEEFSVKSAYENGTLNFEGSFKTSIPVKSFELIGNERELYAVDPEDEFKLDKYLLIKVAPTAHISSGFSSVGKLHFPPLEGSLEFENVSNFYVNLNGKSIPPKGDNYHCDFKISANCNNTNYIYIGIPLKDAPLAKIRFQLKKWGDFELATADLLKNKSYAKLFGKKLFIRIDVMNKLPDHPYPLGLKNSSFAGKVRGLTKYNACCFRLIDENGKIFNSKAIIPDKYTDGNKKKINVYSETKQKAVEVLIPEDALLNLKYDFAIDAGDLILAESNPQWNAEKGAGFYAGHPFRGHEYPKENGAAAPKSIIEKGEACLFFDGKGDYINFPTETISRNSFSIKFSVKPESNSDMVLFSNYTSYYPGAFHLEIQNGRLFLKYYGNNKNYRFLSNLNVLPHQWSDICVNYDLENLYLNINGKKETFPLPPEARPRYYSALLFGCDASGRKNHFKGLLKNLRIQHYCSKEIQ